MMVNAEVLADGNRTRNAEFEIGDFRLWALDFGLNRRHRVIAALGAGMAAANAFGGEPSASDGAVRFERFDGVLRTARFETARSGRTGEKGDEGRDGQAVKPDEEDAGGGGQKAETI
jgi:hypothetical protein